MHVHASSVENFGAPPTFICAPFAFWPAWDPQTGLTGLTDTVFKKPPCTNPLKAPSTDEENRIRTLGILEEQNIMALTGGPKVQAWKAAGKDRILVALNDIPSGSVESLRNRLKQKEIADFAELAPAYKGKAPGDPSMEPYYALAEEFDIPVGIHMGLAPPGASYFMPNDYRARRQASLLLLEDLLVRHPKLRVWAMHAGWPLLDDAIATLFAHPQLYVDVAGICYIIPRADFYHYLNRLIEAGFESRIMFGSDNVIWPDAIPVAIQSIKDAPFLTSEQKRDILYNNAARFLRLK